MVRHQSPNTAPYLKNRAVVHNGNSATFSVCGIILQGGGGGGGGGVNRTVYVSTGVHCGAGREGGRKGGTADSLARPLPAYQCLWHPTPPPDRTSSPPPPPPPPPPCRGALHGWPQPNQIDKPITAFKQTMDTSIPCLPAPPSALEWLLEARF